jgi:fido (protein-threonine AMPylation protein)
MRELAVVEAEKIRKAVVKYLANRQTRRMARFDLSWFLKVHLEMLGEVWAWAATVRTGPANIGVPPGQIEPALLNLASDLASWTGFGHDFLTQSVWLHHAAVRIHPFKNGNGRWSRLLSNIWLKLNRHPLTEWPEDIMGAVSAVRDEYIKAVQAADAGDYELFIKMHRKYTLT